MRFGTCVFLTTTEWNKIESLDEQRTAGAKFESVAETLHSKGTVGDDTKAARR